MIKSNFIEEQLQLLGKYFKNRIINEEYTLLECSEYTATLLIDEQFKIQVWIANNPENNFNIYNSRFIEGITKVKESDYFNFRTKKERITAYNRLKPHIDKYRNTINQEAKEAKIAALKKELEELIK
jgi:hypothetical protein